MNTSLSGVSRELLGLAMAGRPRPAIDYALDLIAGGLPADRLIVEVLADVQREVGWLWQSNQWSVSQEHAATAVIDGVVGAISLQTRTPPPQHRGDVVVACAEEEYHSLPARMGAEQLHQDGWDVTFLGASVPAHDLQKFVVDAEPDAIVLSCTLTLHLPAAARSIAALADVGAAVAVAGAAFGNTPERARRLGASAWIGPETHHPLLLAGPLPPARSTALNEPESLQLQLNDHELVDACTHQMLSDIPSMASYSPRQLSSSRRDLDYILRYLAVAIDLDETALFLEFVSWLADVLRARSVPPTFLETSLDIVGDVVQRAGLDRSAALCSSARTNLDRTA